MTILIKGVEKRGKVEIPKRECTSHNLRQDYEYEKISQFFANIVSSVQRDLMNASVWVGLVGYDQYSESVK